jgi:putative ABC transport system permease protein
MFYLKYLRRELSQRMRQAALTALGLALGIGLVIIVTAAASGVRAAQGTVLRALYGAGTSLTVTKAPAAPKAGQAPPGMITIGPGGSTSGGIQSGGTMENLQNPSLGTLAYSSVAQVARLHGVSAAAGGLALNDFKVTLPSGGPGTGGPGSGATGSSQTFSVDGVDTARAGLGPLGSGTIISGRGLSAAAPDADVAVVDSGFATADNLRVGSKLRITGQRFTVTGIVAQPEGSNPPQVYIPLARAQALYAASNHAAGDLINTIYVSTATAADVAAVQSEIGRLLPAATVTSAGSLAGQVTGSLASTASLANDLGRWLAIMVLIAAFAVASLLTLGAVARRAREFGTLKALGWRSPRIIAQVLGESLAVGILGGTAGVGLGYGAAQVINAIAPSLSATVGTAPPAASQAGTPFMGGHVSGATAPHTVPVHLTAPVPASVIVVAVVLALAGGLLSGSFGSWRIAQLRPAAALARVA